MPVLRNLFTAVLLLAPAGAAADPSLLDFIMPDARVAAGIDVAKIRSSPLLPSFSEGMQNANPEIRKLMQAAGFDPLRDLEEILFASPGTGQHPPALVVARGNFDLARLRAFAELAGSRISEWQGVAILSDPEKEDGAFALLDNVILAGNREQIQAAIGRRGRGMVLNTQMAMRIAELGRRYEAWVVVIAPFATMSSALPAEAKIEGVGNLDMLRSIDQFSVGFRLSPDLTMAADIVANNGKAAGALADSIQMLLALAQQNAKDQPAAMAALKNLDLGMEGNTVHLGITVPAEEVRKAVREAMVPGRKKAPLAASRQPVPEPVITGPQPAAKAAAGAATPASAAAKSPRIPAGGQILIQSSPKDMGTVVILGSTR